MNVFNGGKPPDDIRPTGAISGLRSDKINNMDCQENVLGKVVNPDENAKNNEFSKQVTRIQFLYETTDLAPYQVLIENKDPDFKGKLNPIKVNDIIYACHPELDNKIKEIESTGRNRIRVQCRDGKTANSLILSKYLKDKNLDIYIPKSSVLKQGVIKGLDIDITDEILKNRIKKFDEHCIFSVINTRRITKSIIDKKDNQKKIIQTKSVIVTFKTQNLPNYVALGHVRLEVTPYVQRVMLCYNCFRYGHTSKQCRSKKRCLKCEGDHQLVECNLDKEIKCFYCKGDHATNEIKKCSEFSRQKDIKSAMAHQNLSYKEAEKYFPKISFASIVAKHAERDVDLRDLDEILVNNTQLAQNSKNKQKPNSSYFTQIKTSTKRARPSSPNRILEQHKQILSQHLFPQPQSNILNDSLYQSNLNSIRNQQGTFSQETNKQNLDFNQMVDVVLSVLNILRQKNTFDINKQELENLINTKLSKQH